MVQIPTSQGGHTSGALSPNIPPNPPTSPVDATYDLSNRGGLPKKLNVNAVPFVPGGNVSIALIGAGTINSLDDVKNSAARQLNFPSSDIQEQPESDRTLSGALEKLKIEEELKIPGVVIQTVGEPSCNTESESNSRVGSESNSHSRTDPHLNAAQQNSRTSTDREQSPAELQLDLSTATQQLDNSQRTQPNSSNVHSDSPSHSVSSSDTERQRDVVQDTVTPQATALPTNQTASSHHRQSHTHSPTPTPTSPSPHTPSRTPTPSQANDKPPLTQSSQASSDQEKLKSQEVQQALTQPSSQSCSPGSVSSLSSASLSSTVPSTAGSTTSGSGGAKTKSWASIVSTKSSTNQLAMQVSQPSLAGSPQVHSGGNRASSGDHVTIVSMTTDNQVQGREDVTQQQVPPLNPAKAHAQLSSIGSE